MAALFEDVLNLCRRPTVGVMQMALRSRTSMSAEQVDYINYLAGFTHYREAAQELMSFGLRVDKSVPMVYDTRNRSVHVKVLFVDMDHFIDELAVETIAEQESTKIYVNKIYPRDETGNYIIKWPKRSPYKTLAEHNLHMQSINPGLEEDCTSIIRQVGGYKFIYHATQFALNVAVDMDRLLCHVGMIIIAPNTYDKYNFAFQRLQKLLTVQEQLRKAEWIVIETNTSEIARDFLMSIKANFSMSSLFGKGTIFNDAIAHLTQKLEKSDVFLA